MKRFAPAPHSRLGNTSGTIVGAIVVKENVFFVGATTGRPRFVKEIFGLLLLSFYGWTGDGWSPLRGRMRFGIAVTGGGRRRTNIRGGERRCEKGDIKNAMPKIVDKAGRVW